LAPFESRDRGSENPYQIQKDLQELMQDNVGIVRQESEMESALERLEQLKARAKHAGTGGNREFNPGWHTALDLKNLLTVSETCTRGRVRSPEFLHLRARMNTTQTVQFKIWRGDANGGEFRDYTTECSEGMVVLDAVHDIQRTQANDLACRWNCKAGKCGSCSAEVNGMPKLMCMTRMSELPLDRPITVEPMKAFPVLRDLITDVSWNFRVKKKIKKFKPRPPDAP